MNNYKPITDEELAAMKARADAATPGPWSPGDQLADNTGYDEYEWPHEPDGYFMAYARTDLPRCIAEIEWLRAELKKTQQQLHFERLQMSPLILSG